MAKVHPHAFPACAHRQIMVLVAGRGLVVGQQYIVTFDGQARILSSDCKYLLAKDYIDQLFSVQLQYAKSGNQIIVQYRSDTVVLTVDGNVNKPCSVLPALQLIIFRR